MGDYIHNALIKDSRWLWYVEGVGKTLLISLAAIAIGILIGIIVAIVKYVNKKFGKLKILSKVFDIYLTVFRGTPVYVQLLIMYLVVLVLLPTTMTAIITFGVNSGAYVAEIVRGGLESVDDGQLEAGESLGFSTTQIMLLIVLPQGFRRALPALFNEFIALVKETSIVGTIGVVDITKVAARIVARTYEPFVPYIVSAIIYLVIVIILTQILKILERRFSVSDRKH